MSAVLSPCGRFRYRLERDVAAEGLVFAFFGINPSTADAELDDATVRKWRGFTRANGGRRFIVGNVFPLRATDVRELGNDLNADALKENRDHLQQIAKDADILVPCWGSRDKLPKRLHDHLGATLDVLKSSGKPLRTLGFTASGDPKHPLMLGYATSLIPWPPHR